MLLSFKSNPKLKEQILASTHDWLNRQKIPKSPEEMAQKIFSVNRTFTVSECLLEDYENFPSNLGLPNWLGNLLFTIHHHNSKDFSLYKENYEEQFYPAFLQACNVGVDYSVMFHKWELMILTDMIPRKERNEKYFHDLIQLHKNAVDGNDLESNKWNELQDEIENLQQNIEPRTTMWNSGRTAYLSIENHINKEDPYTTSSEALVDALVTEWKDTNENLDSNSEQQFRKETWLEVMKKLVTMLNEWK
jgi:hypothetical protein